MKKLITLRISIKMTTKSSFCMKSMSQFLKLQALHLVLSRILPKKTMIPSLDSSGDGLIQQYSSNLKKK
jgi:hypothetical protein